MAALTLLLALAAATQGAVLKVEPEVNGTNSKIRVIDAKGVVATNAKPTVLAPKAMRGSAPMAAAAAVQAASSRQ